MKNGIEFESEDKLRDFIKDCISYRGGFDVLNIKKSIENAKFQGYIKKSDLEIAREKFESAFQNASFDNEDLYESLVNYKNELEKEIERLKLK